MVGKSLVSLTNFDGADDKHSLTSEMDWYVVPAVVGGVAAVVLVTALVIFKFIQKRRQAMSDPESRLSAAYRDGFLREDSGPKWRSESLKRSGRNSSNNSTKKDGSVETSLTEDKQQQSRRLINQEGEGSVGCNGNNGYGGIGKDATLWCSKSNNEASRSCASDSSRLNSPRESKIEIETRGEKSYPTIVECVNQNNDNIADEDIERKKSGDFIENCYNDYKHTKDKLTDDDEEGSSKLAENTNEESIEVNHLGKLFFEVRYDRNKLILSVSIIKAQGLNVAAGILGSCDPYVKLQLLPDKKLKVKTRLLRKNQNPVFDEQFDFYNMEADQVEKATLHFSVFSFDRFSRDYVIGEVRYPLAEAMRGDSVDGGNDAANVDREEYFKNDDEEASKDKMIENSKLENKSFVLKLCRDMLPRMYKIGDENRGEVLLSLCYNPGNCQLIVTILKARDLPQSDAPETIEPYVMIYLKFDGQRLAKKRTASKPSTSSPIFNENFTFQLPRTPSELAAMLAWNHCNPLITSNPSSTSMNRKFNLPCRLQGQMSRDSDGNHEDLNSKSRSSLFRRFSICSSTLLDKPNNTDAFFIPKSPTFHRRSSLKRPAHILDRFSLSIFVMDEEQEAFSSEFIGRVELGSCILDRQDLNDSSVDLVNMATASEHWMEIIASPKKQIAKWYQLTN